MKDIAITLPRNLWQKICSGEKKVELRKSWPKLFQHGESKCWVIEKGTSQVLGYCTIGSTFKNYRWVEYVNEIAQLAAVDRGFVFKYYRNTKIAYGWQIESVYECRKSYHRENLLGLRYSPQSFVYVDEVTVKVDVKKVLGKRFRP